VLADLPFNPLTHEILSAAIEVHRTLGPGLLESAYMPCLQYELAVRKMRFVPERSVAIVYKGMTLDTRYRIDLIVEDTVVGEMARICGPDCVPHGTRFPKSVCSPFLRSSV
jgi:GxxExxY protein